MIATGFGFTEGVTWVQDGKAGHLLFSDMPANVIYRWSPDGRTEVALEKCGYQKPDVWRVGMEFTNGKPPGSPEFEKFNAELIGISVDGVWCHGAFARDRKLHFPLLSDFEPKGAMARTYGVYREADGVTERALFVIDGNGVIAWSHISPIGVNPGANGILSTLEELQGKGEERHETVH